MKVNGQTIKRKALDVKNLLMDATIKVIIRMESLMVQDVILGQMENITKENGLMGLSMALECGEVIEEIPTKENGNLVNLRVMVYIHGLMEISIKDNSKNASSMEKE